MTSGAPPDLGDRSVPRCPGEGMTRARVERERCHAGGSKRASKGTPSQRRSRMLDDLDVLLEHIGAVLSECAVAASGELQSPRENSVLLL
jgi:hypothetical protein